MQQNFYTFQFWQTKSCKIEISFVPSRQNFFSCEEGWKNFFSFLMGESFFAHKVGLLGENRNNKRSLPLSFPVKTRLHLFVNVQVLANTPTIHAPAIKFHSSHIFKRRNSFFKNLCESASIPAFGAVMVKDALVSVTLRHRCQLIVPFLTKKVIFLRC